MHYSINGGRRRTVGVASGRAASDTATRTTLLRRVPRQRHGRQAGDTVEVWFTGKRARRPTGDDVTSESLHLHVEQNTGAQVLVLANEDYRA